MYRFMIKHRVNDLEQEIIRKERLALDAKKKGMYATYGNYVMDVSVLKNKLNRMRTSPAGNLNA